MLAYCEEQTRKKLTRRTFSSSHPEGYALVFIDLSSLLRLQSRVSRPGLPAVFDLLDDFCALVFFNPFENRLANVAHRVVPIFVLNKVVILDQIADGFHTLTT